MFDHDAEWGPARHRHQREATLPDTDTQLVMAAPLAAATLGGTLGGTRGGPRGATLLAERRDDDRVRPDDN